ncbi:uncharacterized protein LOC113352663 [Papaver somniferum]|uniref:uncharacterized protein LOC113352663 n=1 Tax=Papaver somniferum TaxID=3469 RepID=UPI000E6F87BE|nr:uncharacterized protein LOC113352663 [Papaver somniferum]
MVRQKQTKRLPRTGPPLGHLANQVNENEEELEPEGGGEEPTEKQGGNEDDNDDGEEDKEDGDKDGDNDESEDDLDEEEDEEEEEQNKIWSIDNECDEVRFAVFDCVLWNEIQHAHQKFDDVTVTAFAERAYPETDTFYLPFAEMEITLNDCFRITALPITGTSVRDSYDPLMSYELLKKLVEKCIGWSDKKAQCHVVNAHYLQLLDPLNEVNNYCWGVAVLSFIQAELRKTSRLKSLCFGGLYTLVQVKASAKLLKKMMAKIRSGEPMDTRQQTDLYNQWTNVFNPNLVDTSQVDPRHTMTLKRSRRQGEDSSRMVEKQSSGDDTPSDDGRPQAPKRKIRKVSRSGRGK